MFTATWNHGFINSSVQINVSDSSHQNKHFSPSVLWHWADTAQTICCGLTLYKLNWIHLTPHTSVGVVQNGCSWAPPIQRLPVEIKMFLFFPLLSFQARDRSSAVTAPTVPRKRATWRRMCCVCIACRSTTAATPTGVSNALALTTMPLRRTLMMSHRANQWRNGWKQRCDVWAGVTVDRLLLSTQSKRVIRRLWTLFSKLCICGDSAVQTELIMFSKNTALIEKLMCELLYPWWRRFWEALVPAWLELPWQRKSIQHTAVTWRWTPRRRVRIHPISWLESPHSLCHKHMKQPAVCADVKGGCTRFGGQPQRLTDGSVYF